MGWVSLTYTYPSVVALLLPLRCSFASRFVVASTTWHSSLASDGMDACKTPYNIFLEYLDRDQL